MGSGATLSGFREVIAHTDKTLSLKECHACTGTKRSRRKIITFRHADWITGHNYYWLKNN